MQDLNEIAIFARVVREQSFTKAARALGLPKSTVSDRVSRLEERLGVRLIERTTRSLRLTDAKLTLNVVSDHALLLGEAVQRRLEALGRCLGRPVEIKRA